MDEDGSQIVMGTSTVSSSWVHVSSLMSSETSFVAQIVTAFFQTQRALAIHANGPWCRDKQNMSEQQLRQLRRFRQVSERRMDVNRLAVEPVTILDINGHRLIAVGEFKYLGTMVTNRGGVAKEVTRRMLLSSSVMASLGKIWTSKVLSLQLKLRLFSAIITSVLLYNSECWSITASDLRLMEGFYFRCLRRITRSVRQPDHAPTEVDKASTEAVFRVANVPPLARILRQKRLRWLGHLIRSDPDDTARICLMDEVNNGSPWWRLILTDLREVGLNSFHAAMMKAMDRPFWRTISSARSER